MTRESGPEAVLKNGFKLNLDVAEFALLQGGNVLLTSSILNNLFQVVGAPPENIQFLYAIFDEGSGREFQNEPILNIAGLGISNGDRPFRYFAQPITFAPQSRSVWKSERFLIFRASYMWPCTVTRYWAARARRPEDS